MQLKQNNITNITNTHQHNLFYASKFMSIDLKESRVIVIDKDMSN